MVHIVILKIKTLNCLCSKNFLAEEWGVYQLHFMAVPFLKNFLVGDIAYKIIEKQ